MQVGHASEGVSLADDVGALGMRVLISRGRRSELWRCGAGVAVQSRGYRKGEEVGFLCAPSDLD